MNTCMEMFQNFESCARIFSDFSYDYVISVYILFHFTTKRTLYKKIKKALKQEGLYIEGDCVVSSTKSQLLAKLLPIFIR
jgi:hypothetical protein